MTNKPISISGCKRKCPCRRKVRKVCKVRKVRKVKFINPRIFTVSGNIGGESSFPIGTTPTTRQQIAVNIPPRRSLILTTARYCFIDSGIQFSISFTGTGISGNRFIAQSFCAEERPNLTLFTNTSSVTVRLILLFQTANTLPVASNLFPQDGWFARFVIR